MFENLVDPIKMNRRIIFHFWLAFLLLFAQGGATAHAISHFADRAPVQSQNDKQLPHSSVCDKCVVYAEVGSAVLAKALFFSPAQHDVAPALHLHEVLISASHYAYSSRAPPRLV